MKQKTKLKFLLFNFSKDPNFNALNIGDDHCTVSRNSQRGLFSYTYDT